MKHFIPFKVQLHFSLVPCLFLSFFLVTNTTTAVAETSTNLLVEYKEQAFVAERDTLVQQSRLNGELDRPTLLIKPIQKKRSPIASVRPRPIG